MNVNETSYGEYERRRAESGFHFLNRVLIAVIIVAFCVGGVITSIPLLKQYREQNETLDRLQKELARKKALYTRNMKVEQLLKNDPAYIEIIARDRLSVMKPGETIIHLDPPRAAASPAAAAASRN